MTEKDALSRTSMFLFAILQRETTCGLPLFPLATEPFQKGEANPFLEE